MIVNRQIFDAKLKALDLNYCMLAQMTGISRGTLSNILNGKTKPSYNVMNLIYYMLSLSPEETVDLFFNNKVMMSRPAIESYQHFFLKNQSILLIDWSQEKYCQDLANKAYY